MKPESIDRIRQACRHRRRQLGLGAQHRASRRLLSQVSGSSLFQTSDAIAFYLANDGEINCYPLIRDAWRQGKACYLPVLDMTEPEARRMFFRRYNPGTPLHNNRYGIPEPSTGKLCLPADLDLVLVPLVAFDSQGNRIGMGGGYYDRAFSQELETVGPHLLGVAHRVQQVVSIEAQSWDVPLDGVIAV